MSTPPPPPPPPGQNPPPYQPGPNPMGGFPVSGMQQAPPQGTNGLSIASLVLSLVNIIPCFWLFPIPALLGVIFGIVSRGQMKATGSNKGKGLAIAGLVVGLVFLAIGVAIWAYVATSDNCVRDGSGFHCGSLVNN